MIGLNGRSQVDVSGSGCHWMLYLWVLRLVAYLGGGGYVCCGYCCCIRMCAIGQFKFGRVSVGYCRIVEQAVAEGLVNRWIQQSHLEPCCRRVLMSVSFVGADSFAPLVAFNVGMFMLSNEMTFVGAGSCVPAGRQQLIFVGALLPNSRQFVG